jgi:cell division protein FtsN
MGIEYRARPAGTAGRPKRRGGKACGFWFVFGLVLGGFGVGLYLMLRPPIQIPAAAVPEQAKAPVQPAKAVPTPGAPTRFDFHDILPELQVVVADRDPAKPDAKHPEEKKAEDKKAEDKKAKEAKADAPKTVEPSKSDPAKGAAVKADATKAPADQGSGSYVLRIASLHDSAAAEQLKAKLAMQGIHAKVHSATVEGKGTFYVVQAGPYQGKHAVDEVRSQLKGKGMETIPVKVK